MNLKHLQSNSLSLFLGIFLALLIVAAPHASRAQDVCDEQGDFNTSFGHTLANTADRLTQVHKDYLHNSPTLDTDHYCIQTLIDAIKDIRIAMIGFDLHFLLMEALIGAATDLIVHAACAIVASLLGQLADLAHSLYLKICLPFPQLRLGLNIPKPPVPICIGFGGLTLAQVGLQPMSTPPNAGSSPNNWQIWGNENSKFKVFVPQGP